MRIILKICYIYYIPLKNKLKYNKIKSNVFIIRIGVKGIFYGKK